ncbi:MAG: AbrB/MazE/SpoVT family DNA-binding domain-containing protein [Deferribacteres bacterium]|nr:AbrB/MazE/SpoVT family DNA-binding domain-containing protein [Deferribacteres bacterium]
MAIVKTSAKGQVVIPRQEREKLGIKPGSKVIVEIVNDHIEIHPLPEKPVEYFCGIFREGSSLTEALLRERKGDLEREEKRASRFLRTTGVSKKRKGL